MSQSSKLHWSFDHNHTAQRPYFAEQLMETLQEYYETQRDNAKPGQDLQRQTRRQVYEALPNFWRGHKGETGQTEDGGYDLRIGNIVLERTHQEQGGWRYMIRFVNTTSGEDLQLNFSCAGDERRSLTGEWQVQTENSAGDLYRRFLCKGRLERRDNGRSDIRLNINGLEVVAGTVDGSIPLTCNWSLFDVIPSLDGNPSNTEIALLEDLEKLRPHNQVGYLENWTLELGQRREELAGYFLRGEGVVPSYWWVDRFGNVVVVSSTLQTFVLKESRILGGEE